MNIDREQRRIITLLEGRYHKPGWRYLAMDTEADVTMMAHKIVSVQLLSKMWEDDPMLSTQQRVYRLTWEGNLVRVVTAEPNTSDRAYLFTPKVAQQLIIVAIDENGYDVYA